MFLTKVYQLILEKTKEIADINESAFKRCFDYGNMIGCGTDAGSPCVQHPSILEELLAMREIVSDNKETLNNIENMKKVLKAGESIFEG